MKNQFTMVVYTIKILLLSVQLCHGIPDKSIEAENISATVLKAQWRGDISYEIQIESIDNGPRLAKVQVKAGWVLLLKDVKGLTENEISSISDGFSIREPAVSFVRLIDRNPKSLYVWIQGDRKLSILPGDQIRMYKFKFSGDERGGAVFCEKVQINSQ